MTKWLFGLMAGVVAACAWTSAQAGEGVLVESVPANVDKAAALAAAKESLLHYEWKVTGEDAGSVSASISRGYVEAQIRIFAKGSSLAYDESAVGRPKLDYTGRWVPSTIATPSRWIEYLRSDVTERLMARAAAPAQPPRAAAAPATAVGTTPATSSKSETAGGRSSVQRLAELKEMLDRGLINAAEYDRKKEEILRAL